MQLTSQIINRPEGGSEREHPHFPTQSVAGDAGKYAAEQTQAHLCIEAAVGTKQKCSGSFEYEAKDFEFEGKL